MEKKSIIFILLFCGFISCKQASCQDIKKDCQISSTSKLYVNQENFFQFDYPDNLDTKDFGNGVIILDSIDCKYISVHITYAKDGFNYEKSEFIHSYNEFFYRAGRIIFDSGGCDSETDGDTILDVKDKINPNGIPYKEYFVRIVSRRYNSEKKKWEITKTTMKGPVYMIEIPFCLAKEKKWNMARGITIYSANNNEISKIISKKIIDSFCFK